MIDTGTGLPLVLIPGIDGHCGWIRPAIDALAREFRVISFSLLGERDASPAVDEARLFPALCGQVDDALDKARVERAVIVGVSYGGLIALQYVAQHPERAAGLGLVSTPPPDFEPTAQQARYLRYPRLLAPAFVLTAPGRLSPEIRAALPAWRDRLRFSIGHLRRTFLSTGMSPSRMAQRMRVAGRADLTDACRRVTVPTLIVTGEPGLDRVVPAEQTRRYGSLIAGSTLVMLPRTGHFGLLTRPDEFQRALAPFVRHAHAAMTTTEAMPVTKVTAR
jgi:pimeloyl-ACP methyl ester carboxylesterase